MRLKRSFAIAFLVTLTFFSQVSSGSTQSKRDLEDLNFPPGLVQALAASGVHSLEDLAELTEVGLSRLEGIGATYLNYIKATLAQHGLTLGPQKTSNLPIAAQPIAVLELPLRFSDSLQARGIDLIGQLLMLGDEDLKRFAMPNTVEKVHERLAVFHLQLNTVDPQYDVGVETAFPRVIARRLKAFGFNTLRELSVLSESECKNLVLGDLRRGVFPAVFKILQKKQVSLGKFPFMGMPFSHRLAYYRRNFRRTESVSAKPQQVCEDFLTDN